MMRPSSGIICSMRFADCAQTPRPPPSTERPAAPAMPNISRREIALPMVFPPLFLLAASAAPPDTSPGSVVVEVIPNRNTVIVEDRNRDLKRCRRRSSSRRPRFDNEKPFVVIIDPRKIAASIGLRDLQLVAFDSVDLRVSIVGDLAALSLAYGVRR